MPILGLHGWHRQLHRRLLGRLLVLVLGRLTNRADIAAFLPKERLALAARAAVAVVARRDVLVAVFLVPCVVRTSAAEVRHTLLDHPKRVFARGAQ